MRTFSADLQLLECFLQKSLNYKKMSNINKCSTCGSGGIPLGCGNKGYCEKGGCNKLEVFDWLANTRESAEENSFEFVEVRFKNDRKDFFRNIHSFSLNPGDIIAVEGMPGHDIGIVTLTGEMVKIQMKGKKINFNRPELFKKIYRIANQKDIDKWHEVRAKEYEVMVSARKLVNKLKLDMKICDVEYQGNGAKATFYYTAEDRVDFRMLVKELAVKLHIRIEMRQIGYRQAAAKVGGIGSCGRELCCSTWLTDFRTVNTVAARYQQLSINPQKLAGQCGKLKCCLNFELDAYLEAVKFFPDTNVRLYTEKGTAHCMKLDIFKREIWYAYPENSISWYKLSPDNAWKIIQLNKKGKNDVCLEDYVIIEEDTANKIYFEDASQSDNIDRFDSKSKKKNSYTKSK